MNPIGQLLSLVPEKARAELFKYDPMGNLYETGEGAAERVYGPGNRLLRKGDTEYVWDWDGRLIEQRRRSAAGEKEEVWRYAWSGAGLLKQVDRPDGLRVEFTYDPFARRISKRVTHAGETVPSGAGVGDAVRVGWGRAGSRDREASTGGRRSNRRGANVLVRGGWFRASGAPGAAGR